ncbi:MAG: GMC family oxidoreductase [Planctomycetes bacterium]|nr:GMC family oxidoreductase [Planctomycetota bacterium]
MAAHRLVSAGWRVVMLERGPWVERGPHSADPAASMMLTPHYSTESAYRVPEGAYGTNPGAVCCVGGPSVYYGGASFRLREADFTPGPDVVGSSGARWPFGYGELEPYYAEAERLLDVAGDDADDPTRPPRSGPYPQPAPPLPGVSQRFRDAARALGLNPFPLPLAINFAAEDGRTACEACRTCDTYACAVEAKNDLAVALLRPLVRHGLEVRPDTVATGLAESGGRISEVRAWDKVRQEAVTFRGRHVMLAAGALGTPHLILTSELQRLNPAGDAVGSYLMRHCSAIVAGFCSFRPDPDRTFHKNLAILDYYFGDRDGTRLQSQRIGSIQQMSTLPVSLMKSKLPRIWNRVPLDGFVEHLTAALVIAEDEPQRSNRVTIDRADPDAFGVPRLCVAIRYSARDEERRRLLVHRAKRILRQMGAWSFLHAHSLKTFSHALGTVRMGVDPATAPLDEFCRYRGVQNLLVVDGSTLPTSGAVNPSLTIGAIALRAAEHLLNGTS